MQESIHLLEVGVGGFPFLLICSFHSQFHSRSTFWKIPDFLKNTCFPECQTQSVSPRYFRFLGHLQELANDSMLQTAGLLNYTIDFLSVHVGIILGHNPQAESFLTVRKKNVALWDRGTLSPFKKAVNLSNLFTGFRKLSLEGKRFFLEFFFFPSLPKLQIGFWVFSRDQRPVHAVINLLVSVVVWEGLTEKAVLYAVCGCPHAWFGEVVSKANTANVSGLVIFTHKATLCCFCHRQSVIGFKGGLWVPYRQWGENTSSGVNIIKIKSLAHKMRTWSVGKC